MLHLKIRDVDPVKDTPFYYSRLQCVLTLHLEVKFQPSKVTVTDMHLNHMAGLRGPTRSQLYNKLRSVVNIAPIHTKKAAIDSSHRDLRVAIFKPNFCFRS